MDTEYRRGIPSTAHVEAATRLGLLWHRRGRDAEHRTRFVVENGQVLSDYGEEGDQLLALGPVTNNERHYAYYCIRPDGTPVDWEVLDLEVARVGQPATVTSTASAAPTTQPQGFRADLWARLNEWVTANWLNTLGDIRTINDRGISGHSRRYSWDELGLDTTADEADRQTLIARWTVYQELKPLYDLVDGAQGEAAMPRDVEAEWYRAASGNHRMGSNPRSGSLARDAVGMYLQSSSGVHWRPEEGSYGTPLRNFATVLDAVAERRVAERNRGQAQAPTVTSAQPEQHRHNWIYDGLGGGHNGQYNHNCACGERDWFAEPMSAPSPRSAVVRPAPAQPEPRRFADVRPDRHGWRWWRLVDAPGNAAINGSRFEAANEQWRWLATGSLVGSRPWAHIDSIWNPRTVIPTDEQGNPVSWEAAGFAAEAVRLAQENVQRAANDATPARSVGDIEWTVTGLPVTRDMTVEPAVGTARSRHVVRLPAQAPEMQSATEVPALSRIALIEIDDADPTAERIRLEQEAERQRLAELRLRLAAERPVQMAKESDTVSRFDLIEPDPQADPAASIRAWEARQKRSTVRLMPKPQPQPQPLPAPCRLFEVVDAEAEGLRPGAVFTALLGRALNPNC